MMKYIVLIALLFCLAQTLPIDLFNDEFEEIENEIEKTILMEVRKAEPRISCNKPYHCQPQGYCQQYHSKQQGYCVKKLPAKAFCTMNMQCISNNCEWFKCK